jgi:hypothetical protein
MGGKSSCVRQVATLALMAQVGSFVPAAALRMRPFDGVFVRMGASDNLAAGHSTFFVELHETSGMLQRATARSLLLLDELGRGTSTTDGTAIAHATLEHIARSVGAACLFVTHYPSIGVELERALPRDGRQLSHGATWRTRPTATACRASRSSTSCDRAARRRATASTWRAWRALAPSVLRVAATQSEMLQRSETVTQFLDTALAAAAAVTRTNG